MIAGAAGASRLLALGAGILLTLSLLAGCGREGEEGPSDEVAAEEQVRDGEDSVVVFPDRNGGLVRVRVALPPAPDAEARLRQRVEALLAGPGEREDLVAPFGEEVALGELHLDPRGTVYVDLVSETLPDPPGSGSQIEIQRVFSVVNTLLLGGDARAVVLLWNGRQRPTFAGHVDTGRPLALHRGLLRGETE